MDKSQSLLSGQSQNSPDSRKEESSDQTKDSSESISGLNEKLESSLYISEKSRSKSSKIKANEPCNVSQASDFQRNRSNISTKQSCLKGTAHCPYESGFRKRETPKSMKTVDDKSFSKSKQSVDSKKDTGMKRQPFCSGEGSTRKISYSHPKTQNFPSSVPVPYFSGYHPNVNPTLLPRSTNPIQNQACVYPRRFLDRNIVAMQENDYLQYQYQTGVSVIGQNYVNASRLFLPARLAPYSQSLQVPLPNIGTAANPVALLSRNGKTLYFNPRPPIRTNVTPMPYVQHSSRYQTRMRPIRANVNPMRYAKRSPHYKSQKQPIRTNTEALRNVQPPRATTPGRIPSPQDVIQSRFELSPETPDQASILPVIQPQNSASKETDNRHTISSNVEQSEKVRKFGEFAKRSHYSKKNMLSVEIPPKLIPYFPLYSPPQQELFPRQLQRSPIQFPTPSGSICLGSSFGVRRGVIPHQSYQYMGTSDQSTSCGNSRVPLVVIEEIAPLPATQDNVLFQYGSHSYNPIQLEIQAKIIESYNEQYQRSMQSLTAAQQYQPTMQNLTAAQQYQDPNQPMYEYGVQHPSTLRNLTAATQYQDPNQPIYQHGTLHQPALQNLTETSNYRDPNSSMYKYETQYQSAVQNSSAATQYEDPNLSMYQYGQQYELQPALRNLTTETQYQDPNPSVYQYGTQKSLETSYPTDASWSYPIHDKSISPQQENPNIVPMQTSTTNLSLSSTAQILPLPYESGDPSYPFTGNPNLVPEISDVQTSVDCPSSISISHYSPWPYATADSTSRMWMDNPSQGSTSYQGPLSVNNPEIIDTNTYPAWSVSICDPHEETPIYESDETSKNH